MSKKHAVVVSHSYYLRDTRFRRHAQALSDDGWEVDVVCAGENGEPRRERFEGVAIHRLPARRRRGSKLRYAFEYGSFGAMALATIAALDARKRCDLVYAFSIPNLVVRSAAVPRFRGARVILDMRDPMPEFFRSKYGFAEDHPFVRALLAEERVSCRYATHVVTVIDAMRNLFLRSVGPERISVVMNAPDARIFDAIAPYGPARDPGDRTILYAGTVAERYGVDLLVRAVARLRDTVPGIRLRIVGDGDIVPALRSLAMELGVRDRISFDGPVPLQEIPAIVRSAWLGAQPHRIDPLMRYCFSTKVLEWCALGLPVVCSRTDAFDQTFEDDQLLFVAPGDLDDLCRRIVEANEDPAGLARRAGRAAAHVRRFDWDTERTKLLAIANGPLPRDRMGRSRR
jgi:glycosyltransferase involved in cell wall biosynthesis